MCNNASTVLATEISLSSKSWLIFASLQALKLLNDCLIFASGKLLYSISVLGYFQWAITIEIARLSEKLQHLLVIARSSANETFEPFLDLIDSLFI